MSEVRPRSEVRGPRSAAIRVLVLVAAFAAVIAFGVLAVTPENTLPKPETRNPKPIITNSDKICYRFL
jgi:hypothetical protein